VFGRRDSSPRYPVKRGGKGGSLGLVIPLKRGEGGRRLSWPREVNLWEKKGGETLNLEVNL